MIFVLLLGVPVWNFVAGLPKDFLYQDQSVGLLCFYQVQATEEALSLKKCGIKADSSIKNAGYYIVYSINNGDGTRIFSTVSKVRRKGDVLLIQALRIADLCKGGINDVSVKGQTLTYRVNMTPYDFLELGNQDPPLFSFL